MSKLRPRPEGRRPGGTVRFGEFELVPESYELRRSGEAVHVEPRVFEVLSYLIAHRGRVVTKDELLAALWTGEAVTDSALSRVVRDARRALGDSGSKTGWIRTVYGRGFRFAGAVTGPAAGPGTRGRQRDATGEAAAPGTQGGDATLAVLPFANLSPDTADAYFAQGMTEELVGALARIPGLRVVGGRGGAAAAGRDSDPREVGAALGAPLVLVGSVRRAGATVRISARLVEVKTGFHVWAEDFQGSLRDVFALQEGTALAIARGLRLELTGEQRRAVRRRHTEDVAAFDHYLRARALMTHWDDRPRLDAARDHLGAALARDPEYAPAVALLARVETEVYRNLEPRPERLVRAAELAQRALALAPDLPEAHLAHGRVLGNRYDYVAAAEAFGRARDLAPDDPVPWDELAWALAYQTPPAASEAEEAAREAIRLAPTMVGPHYHLGRALLLRGRFADAWASFEHARQLDPAFAAALTGMAEVHLERGEPDAGLELLARNRPCRESPPLRILRVGLLARLGEIDDALAELEAALAAGYGDFAHLEATPRLARLRADRRFPKLLLEYSPAGHAAG